MRWADEALDQAIQERRARWLSAFAIQAQPLRQEILLAIDECDPLILHHPEDKLCWHIDDEYYFGNDFLVAPVMNSENHRDIYLPEGKWVNFFTGERLEGACWLKDVYVPLEEMPVYVRANAVIPIYPEDVDCTDEMDLSKSMALRIDNDYKGFWTMIDCGRKLINLV